MGPGVYVCDAYNRGIGIYENVLELSNHRCPSLCVYAASGPEIAAATAATCDFLVRLLATSKTNKAFIRGRYEFSVPISGPGLSHFFQESQDSLRKVTLEEMILNEEQIHALATTESRPEMEVILNRCKLLRDPGCHAAFVECLHLDGAPIKLYRCEIDCRVLAAALEGNSRVTRLELAHSGAGATSDAEKGVIFRSLAKNKSLLVLDLIGCSINDENWTVLCHSVQGHPALTILDLRSTNPPMVLLADEQKAQRKRELAAMVEDNQVLRTIRLGRDYRDEQIYAESILPHLEMNLYRPRVLGIKRVDIAFRRAVLGLALQTESVRSKSNLLWMFLSGNQDVVLQSDEETAAVLQSDGDSSEQDEEVASRKRKL
jgi:hypothetical protein